MSTTRAARPRSRRTFLRGAGGFVLALPFLEYFAPKQAFAEGPPKRYVFAFAGSSIGFSGGDSVIPKSLGPLADNLSLGLKPLGDLGITDVVSCVSGLKIPWASNPPPGGRVIQWHASSPPVIASGVRSDPDKYLHLQGPTSDQIAGEVLHAGTDKDVLTYRVQAASYRGENSTGGSRGILTARIANGKLEEIPPISSPHVAYQALFTGFVPDDPVEAEKAKLLLKRRQSVVDLVLGDAKDLIGKLGKADQIRMQRHFDELQALENKLKQVPPPMTSTCSILPDPGADPPIGDAVEPAGNYTEAYEKGGAYSDEEARATIMGDLLYMAFACDLSRVASWMFTYSQSFMNMKPLTGDPSDLHELGHYSVGSGKPGQDAMARAIAWHVKHWGRLIQRLRDTNDPEGSPILDNTSLVLAFEGGIGHDPEQGKDGSSHSSENMMMLIAGRAGGLHATEGRHIRAKDHHPCEVINTALAAAGVNKQLGEVSGTIGELFG